MPLIKIRKGSDRIKHLFGRTLTEELEKNYERGNALKTNVPDLELSQFTIQLC